MESELEYPDVFQSAVSEEQKDERNTLAKRMCALRRDKVNFTAPSAAKTGQQLYGASGPMTSLFQRSKLCQSGLPAAAGAVEVQKRAFLISADLLPMNFNVGVKDGRDFEALPEVSEEFNALLEWVKMMRQAGDMIIAFDGRSREVRQKLGEYFAGLGDSSRYADGVIIYKIPPSGDPRFQKRKVAWSARNRESFFLHFPGAKVGIKAVQRESTYMLTGSDGSTHESDYIGVNPRSMEELPRLSHDDKGKVHGSTYSPSHPDKLVAFIGQHGVPLCWSECKSVKLCSTFFKDLGVTHIFDLGAGSGAAAVSAYTNGICYEGVCANDAHKAWLDRIMDNAAFALLADVKATAGSPFDKKTTQMVKHYFTGPISEGQRCMKEPHHRPKETVADDDY